MTEKVSELQVGLFNGITKTATRVLGRTNEAIRAWTTGTSTSEIEEAFARGDSRVLQTILRRLTSTNFLESYKESGISQYRAISERNGLNYLYQTNGTTEVFIHPITDILLFLNRSKPDGIASQIAVEGPPLQFGQFESESPAKKQGQYSTSPKSERKFRTIPEIIETQRSWIRGLYLFSQVVEICPEELLRTLNEYINIAQTGEQNKLGMIVGLLEVEDRLGLLKDKRFAPLTNSLATLALEEAGGYKKLREKYDYLVIQDGLFWEEQAKNRQGPLYWRIQGKAVNQTAAESQTDQELWLPHLKDWEEQLKFRQIDVEELGTITNHQVLTRQLRSGGSEHELVEAIKQGRQKKASLAEAVRVRNLRLTGRLDRVWQKYLREISPTATIGKDDYKTAESAIRLVGKYFIDQKDTLLSSKAKTNFSGSNPVYSIDINAVADDPLFKWIFSLREPKVVKALEVAISRQPEDFALLLRLMVQKAAGKFFLSDEVEFILDPKNKKKADPENLKALLDKLGQLVQTSKPDVIEVFRESLRTMENEIKDLVDPTRIKGLRGENLDLIYRRRIKLPLVGEVVFDTKAKKFNRRDFLKLGIAAATVAVVGKGIPELAKIISRGDQAFVNLPNILIENYIAALSKLGLRLPDSISRSELNKLSPFYFGRVINLPRKFFIGSSGESIGFFPINIQNLIIHKEIQGSGPIVKEVDYLSEKSVVYNPDQLVYMPDKLNDVIFAPAGWRIVKVYQEKGKARPLVGGLHELYFYKDYSNHLLPPEKIILVLEKAMPDQSGRLSPRVAFVKDVHFSAPDKKEPYLDKFAVENVNTNIANDRKLRALHTRMIEEFGWADYTDPETISQLVIKYTLLFGQYTDENRYYALNIPKTNTRTDNDFKQLIAIADNHDSGYPCGVAAEAYRGFMQSVEIWVDSVCGYSLNNYNRELWGRIGHMTSIVFLPNGKVLEVDMTPNVTDRTPQEDLEALKMRPPSTEELMEAKNKETVALVAAEISIGTAAAAALYFGLQALTGESDRKAIIKKVSEALLVKEREIQPIEQELIAGVLHHLSLVVEEGQFEDEIAQTLTVLGSFSADTHSVLVNYLLDQPQLLAKANLKECRSVIASQKKNLGVEEASDDSLSFDVVYRTALLISRLRQDELKSMVDEKLKIGPDYRSKVIQGIVYRGKLIIEAIKERLIQEEKRPTGTIKPENKPLIAALNNLLS